MQPDNKNMSDLEYLADLGFNEIAITDKDVSELKSKIKTRTFSYNSGAYFAFISLITGFFIGISVFFNYYNSPRIYSSKSKATEAGKVSNKETENTAIILDTISVIKDNFVKEINVSKKAIDTLNNTITNSLTDTALMVISLPIPELKPGKIKEAQIKYFANSSIIYLYDLKITEYPLLYFKQNKFISLSEKQGLSAAYANKEDLNKEVNILDPAKPYYLHQAIAEAMLFFKNKNYNACINCLNKVAEYTGNDINCRFYYGMCCFYKKNYPEAIKNFDQCITNANNSFLQEAEYYKALSLAETGNKEASFNLLKKIAEEGEFYSDKAKQAAGL